MESLSNTLNALNSYFEHPESEDALASSMEKYHSDRDAFNRDFYRITLNLLSETSVKKLLNTLGVPKNQHGRYLNQNITVYDFLKELEARERRIPVTDQKTPLKRTIDLINEHNQTRWKALAIWIALLSLCSIAPFWVYGLRAIEQFVTTASVICAAGLGYSVAIALYTLYEYTPAVGREYSWYRLFKDNFFALSNSALVVSGWAILLTAAASDPVITVLFIAAELVFVVEEIWNLVKLAYRNHPTIESPSLPEKQQQARESADFEKRKHDVYVKLAAAILMTVIIAAWCLIPGGFLVPVICMASIGIVKATTQWAIWKNEARIQDQLLTQFNAIEFEFGIENNPPQEPASHLNEMAPTPISQNRPRSNSEPIYITAIASRLGLFRPESIHRGSFVHDDANQSLCSLNA